MDAMIDKRRTSVIDLAASDNSIASGADAALALGKADAVPTGAVLALG